MDFWTSCSAPSATPPANVSNFAPQDKKAPPPKNFREKLAQHAIDSTCAACHKRIDPLGFVRWKTTTGCGAWRLTRTPATRSTTRGRLPGGKEFHVGWRG